MFELIIGKNDAGQRLDKFIAKALPAMPAPMVYRLIRQKKIKLNRKRTEPGVFLAENDRLQIFAAPHFGEREDKADVSMIHTEPDVIYEDDNIVIMNKPAGLLVHPDENGAPGCVTLVAMLQAYLLRRKEYDPDKEQSFAPALANRIDRNTSGIVLAAKNSSALRALEEALRERTVTKKYVCIVHGVPAKNEATLEGYLIKDEKTKTVRITSAPSRNAKKIRTSYKVIRSGISYSLLEVRLYTGRTHQIRAQLAEAGMPLLGDGKYGTSSREDKKLGYTSQALCSRLCSFDDISEPLSYLKGKEFVIPDDKIDFVRDFYSRLISK